MTQQAELEKLTQLAEAVAARLGVTLVGVRFGQSGGKRSLIVTIFCPGKAVSLDNCEAFSRALENDIDLNMPETLNSAYLLEVESPGIERQLTTEREFQVFSGQMVEVLAKEKIEGLGVSFAGRLLGGTPGTVLIANPRPLTDKSRQPAKNKKEKQAGAGSQALPADGEVLELKLDKLIRVKLAPDLQANLVPGGGQPPLEEKMDRQLTVTTIQFEN